VNHWTKLLIWAVAIGVIFGVLWAQGQIRRLAAYAAETREELKKCSWPTWDELKGSTVLIAICVALLGLFTFVTDQVLLHIFFRAH
jgi:preprotein translocase subunit SecE